MKQVIEPIQVSARTPPPSERLKQRDPDAYYQSLAGVLKSRVNLHNSVGEVTELISHLKRLVEEEAWEHFPVNPKTRNFSEYVITITGYRLSDILNSVEALLEDDEAIRELRAIEGKADGALIQAGGDRRSEDFKRDNITLESPARGTSSAYLLRRMAREDKENKTNYLDRYEAGEFPSVRQAAIAAGIVKEKTPLEKIQALLPKLTPEERATLKAEL